MHHIWQRLFWNMATSWIHVVNRLPPQFCSNARRIAYSRLGFDRKMWNHRDLMRHVLPAVLAGVYAILLIGIVDFQTIPRDPPFGIRYDPLIWRDSSGRLVAALILAIAPFTVWRALSRPSDGAWLYLLMSTYIPAILFLMLSPGAIGTASFWAIVSTLAAFAIIGAVRCAPLPPPVPHPLARRAVFAVQIVMLGIALPLLVLFHFPELREISVVDVYDRRLAIHDAIITGGSAAPVYLTNALGLGVAPVLMILATLRGNVFLGALAILVAGLAFAISTHRFVLLYCAFGLLFCTAFRIAGPARRGIATLSTVLIFFVILPIVFDLVRGGQPEVSVVSTFRLILNNGFLVQAYVEVFAEAPPLLYADSFLKAYIESPFDKPYGLVVGDHIAREPGKINFATAGFLADGFANLHHVGMIVAAAQVAFVLWLGDWLARGRDLSGATALLIVLAMAFSNAPVHTTLLSGGGFLLVFSLLLLPATRPTAEPSFPRR